MTKGNLIATSLVGAIPGGFLAYFTIMAFINYAENMAVMLQVVTGTTLLFAVLMALSPIAILLFSKGQPKEEAAEESAASSAVAPVMDDAEEEFAVDEPADDEVAEAAEFDDDSLGTDDEDMSLSGFTDMPDETSEASDDAFDFDDDSEFEFDDEDFK